MPPTDLITASSSAAASASASNSASAIYTSMPLTTVFTPAASCSDRPFTYWTDDGTTSTFWRDLLILDITDTDCYPSGYIYQHEPGVTAVYSPGVCPEHYYAAQYTANGPTGAQTSWCCPSGATYGNGGCQRLVTSNTIAIDGESTISMTEPFIAEDWYIQVAWAQDNLNRFTPASAPVLTTTSTSASSITSVPTRVVLGASSPTVAGLSSVSATAAAIAGNSNGASSGLSTGAKAGIGVGVALGAIAVISLIAFLILRKKRKSKWSAAPSGPKGGDNAYSQDAKYGPLHSQPAQVHEAGDTSRPAEVYGDERTRAEMQGSEFRPYRAELDGDQHAGEARGKYT